MIGVIGAGGRTLALAGLLAAGIAGPRATAGAQDRGRDRVSDRVSERVQGARPAAERMAQAVRERLGLTDEQARRLRETTTRFGGERQALLRQERALRRDLRAELARGGEARQEPVGRMLDDLIALQRRRADLLSGEQRALAEFLTPVQRAEFLALQERAFRAAQQMRARREGRGERVGGAPPR